MSEDKVLAELLTYDPNDYGAPMKSKKVDVRPTIRTDYNPYQNYYSLTGVNTVDINERSNRELAQNGKI